MKNRRGRRKRQFSKKSASLTVEFLERRVVLNADPTGGVLITGSPFEGQALTASNNIVDADGLGPIAYQWKSDSDPIPDATSPTYVLQDSDVGNVISVVATYTDLLGTEEVVSSQPTVVIESSSPPVRQSSAVSYSPEYTSINGRTFGYYVPESYDPSTPTPLLFMFHGAGGNSSEQSGGSAENGYYGWQTSAHENGFIVLFPESSGYFKTWNLGAGGSSSDLSFVDDMVDWATSNYNISTSQIFTTGHSWGAYFSYYVATFRSDDIAAFGAHSGGLGGAFFLGNTPSVPTGPTPTPSLNGIVLHAVDDGIVPYSNSQNLYDDLVANGHNVYDDGIGADGIIEVDGWGPDNHRYRKQHNQTQWDFFLSVAPDPVTSNKPPEFNQPLDLILNEDASPQSVALTGISSGDGVMQPVRVTATSSNPGLIPDPTVSYTNSSDTASLVVAPVANQYGAATITVTVEDGGLDNNLETTGDNAIVSQTFEVTVSSINDPGSFTGDTSATGSEDESAITGTLVFTDAIDGDSAPNYTVTSESSNGAASINATTGAWSYTPNVNFNGSDSFTVAVTDDEGNTETQVVSLIVASVNDAGSFTGDTSATGSEDDSAITGTVVFTDVIDGDSAPNYTITSEPSNGAASINAATGAWSYTSNTNFNGSDFFTVAVTDDDGHTETQVISLIVEALNDPGSFSGDTSATASEDESAIAGTVVFTDAIDGASAPNYAITSESSNGAASIDATTGAWSYTPNVNFNGSDSFTVAVTDDEGNTETQVVSLIVTSVNDPGSFTGDTSATGSEDDSAITGTVVFTDVIDGDSAPNYAITSESNNGTASIDATTGIWSYTPNANFNGSDSFTVAVTDDEGNTETQVVSLIVASVNDPGSFSGDISATGSEDDSAIAGTLVFTDAIDGASAPNYAITSESSNGAASIDATTGAWSYTPNANFNGSDSFTVAVTDDEGNTETQVISLFVTSVGDAGSFSGNTSATGSEDESAITGTLIFTDAIDGDSAPNYTITSESSNGTASIDAATGAWSYTPNANFNGSDFFTVAVTDDEGNTETQVISLIVSPVNDPGSFTGDTSATGSEDDSAITGTLTFTDAIDGDSAPGYTITSELSNGTASIDATTGVWSYAPNANFNGSDSFTVAVTDDEGNTETQVISLIVEAVNDASSFSGDTSATGLEDESAITGTLVFTDAIDGDSAPNYTVTSESSNGTASIDATTGVWSYTPDANFNGSDSFTVAVTDDEGNTETQVVSLTVTSVNDDGSFSGDSSAPGSEDGSPITGTLVFTDVIDGDSAPNYTVTSESSNGTASIDATTGIWSYTPNANFNGSDSFTVAATDDEGNTETQVVSLIVASVNDAGSFTGDISATGSEDDSAITGTLVFTDAIDGDSAPNYAITSESSNGTASIDATTGMWSYTPNANFNGSDSFTVAATDDEGNTETQVVSLTVTSVNDPGSFSGDISATGSEDDSAITGTVVFTDAIDGDSAPNYAITSESSNSTASIDATTGAWSYTPNANFNGSDSFTVAVTDDEGNTETQVVSLIVTSVNDPGSFSGDISATGSEDESAIAGTVVFTDAIDGASVPNYTITSESSNGTASIDATTGAWSYTPNANFNGSGSFAVAVTDDEGHTETQVISLLVEAVNDVPTLDALADITRNEGDREQTVSLTGITAGGGETQLLSITAVSDNTGLIPDPTVDFDSQSSTGTLKFTPAADQFGTAVITVLVEDGGLDNDLGTKEDNGTVSRAFDVVLAPVNDEPMFDPIADLVLAENSLTQVLDITGITAGAGENQPLQITTSSSNTSVVLHPTVTSRSELGSEIRLITVTPVPDQYGIATITVTVEDGGLDLDLDTAEDNAMFSRTFDVTVTPDTDNPPTQVTPHGRMFIHETLSGDPQASYQLPAVNVNGEAINGLVNRITATSSNTALIPDPTVLFASADVPSSLSFTPVVDANGTAMLSIQVEDGGLDNDFATTEDNRQATHQVEVNVLEVISSRGSAILAKDSTENLYVNTQPVVFHDQQQAQSNIAGFAAIGASSEDGENALLVERGSVTNRLVTDDAWRINGLFNSLQNESSSVLDLSAREVSVDLNIVAVAGAYEINGVRNPTLVVRRGQIYNFKLDVENHPFFLQTTGNGFQPESTYNQPFQGQGRTAGEYMWIVPADAPDELYYQCEFHPTMFGKIIVVD